MGVLGNLLGKNEENTKAGAQKSENDSPAPAEAQGKYDEPCSLCGGGGTEKKWAGKYWHVKCVRKMRKLGRGML